MSLSWIPWNHKVLELEDLVSEVFAIHDVSTQSGNEVVVFQGQFLRSPEMVYSTVAAGFKARGYVPILREKDGQDILMAFPSPTAAGRSRLWLHGLLFGLTILTTLWAGVSQSLGTLPGPSLFMANWQLGIPFMVPLLAILGVHEFGHYFVARHYKLDVSLPYFIPFPNPLVGTMGAVIRIQSPFESKKALFDVGIAGPLAGLAVAIPVVVYGLMHAEVQAIATTADTMVFGEPLLFRFLAWLIVGPRGAGEDIIMNPFLMAGWLGFLVTALNLIPVSQLDGGHIAYAILGRFDKYFAWGVFATAAAVTLLEFRGFVLMLAFIFLMGVEHPPALDDITRIGWPRVLLGILALLLAISLITISPFKQP